MHGLTILIPLRAPAAIALTLALSLALCAEASAQTRAEQDQTTAKPMRLQAASAGTAEIRRFCDPSTVQSATRGRKVMYSCQSGPQGGSMSIQAHPDVQRSEINCSYTESGGVTKWLSCSCKANDEGNCNHFITDCIEDGDSVEGNSGGASCKPSSG